MSLTAQLHNEVVGDFPCFLRHETSGRICGVDTRPMEERWKGCRDSLSVGVEARMVVCTTAITTLGVHVHVARPMLRPSTKVCKVCYGEWLSLISLSG